MDCGCEGPQNHSSDSSCGARQKSSSQSRHQAVPVRSQLALVVAESEGSVVHSLVLLALDGELHHERSQGRQSQGHQLGSLDGGGPDSRETPSPESA